MKMHLDSMIKGDPKLGFGRTDINESRFDPSKNPTAKVDKEFDDARNALRKAGIPHMGQRAIGSMNRERNKFRVHPKFEKKARQALKGSLKWVLKSMTRCRNYGKKYERSE